MISIFRLQNGEDIISAYEEVDGSYVLHNPLKIVYYTNGVMDNLSSNADKFIITLLPWMFITLCVEQVFTIHSKDILTMAKPSTKLEEYYYTIKNKLAEVFTSPPVGPSNPPQPNTFNNVEEELEQMGEDENKVDSEEFLNMVRNKLSSISKRTLH